MIPPPPSIVEFVDEIEKNKILFINKNWKEFKLSEILKILGSGKELTNTEDNEGIYPLVVAKKDNNGVGKHISNGKLKFNGNKIVMIKTGDGGAGLSYYHSDDFFATTSVMILEENNEKFAWKLNENIGLFLVVAMKNFKNIFSHSNGVNEEKFNSLVISLPSKNDEPDWEYMDKFIELLKNNINLC